MNFATAAPRVTRLSVIPLSPATNPKRSPVPQPVAKVKPNPLVILLVGEKHGKKNFSNGSRLNVGDFLKGAESLLFEDVSTDRFD